MIKNNFKMILLLVISILILFTANELLAFGILVKLSYIVILFSLITTYMLLNYFINKFKSKYKTICLILFIFFTISVTANFIINLYYLIKM
jgi:hypothetical protein